jgi:hypothetical protein
MAYLIKVTAAATALLLIAQPAQACWTDSEASASSIAKLDSMLMVTALRCRTGQSNFLPEYNRFVKVNHPAIAEYNAIIKARFARAVGSKAATRAMDRFYISIANSYGAGNTAMGCEQLKSLASDLAGQSRTRPALTAIAVKQVGEPTLPGGRCTVRVAAKP